ncbi:MAG: hypothetical protein L0H63_05945, partial [Nitrococcus sp.]|nr:hypothetical protein [Nitrococcus sp.]
MTERVETLLHAAARSLTEDNQAGESPAVARARALVAALQGPTELCKRHPDGADYIAALAGLDAAALAAEGRALGETMDACGLVSPPHALFLRFVAERAASEPAASGAIDTLLADALALKRVGRTSLAEHRDLVVELIELAVTPQTERCVYGLSRLLERGILFSPPVAPGLRRLALLPIHPKVAQQLQSASGYADDAQPARTLLLAGTLSVLGQPLGMDQGHNPTCQSARAISLWSQNDAGYLLALIAHAARDNEVVAQFEGETIHSGALSFGLAGELHRELDPVSLLLTPHLDKIYMEMSRRTIGRSEDGHRWVNPEQHGWWVYRGFAAVVDPASGALSGFDAFIRRFYAAYHPEYNGGRDLVYAQPCGVAVTDHDGVFVGWHAVSIQRVASDDAGLWRVYFFNPNHDSGQDWGQGVVTSTCHHGEREGESSLAFEQFAARLYVFHYKQQESGDLHRVAATTVAEIRAAAAASWAAQRIWLD